MPRVNMISEHVAILVAEQLLTEKLIHPAMISGRRELVDCILRAGEIEIGQTYIPPGDYEDWFEPMESVEEERVVSPAEKALAIALLKIIDDASIEKGGA